MTKRMPEFILGLLGGIFGFLGALVYDFFIQWGANIAADSSNYVSLYLTVLEALPIIFAIMGIVGAALVFNEENQKIAGALMVIGAIGGLISASVFFILGAVLLLIAGIMTLAVKK